MKTGERLTENKDFQNVYKNGRSVANKYLVLYFLGNKGPGTRVGISVSKKIGSAVVRNRIKRLIKESFRLNREAIKEGFDLVFIARQPSRKKSFQEIEKAFIDVLEKAGLYKDQDERDTHTTD